MSVYRGAMRPRALLERYAVEALALALALAGQLELWAGSSDGPRAAAVVAALVATVPLLLRRRFPFGAPAFLFAGLALVSLLSPAAVYGGRGFAALGLLLSLWCAPTEGAPRPASTPARVAPACVAGR